MSGADIVERLKGNPKTTIAGVVCGALYALGDYLHAGGVEPWGALALGAAGVVGVVGLLLARDGGKPPAPPAEPPVAQ